MNIIPLFRITDSGPLFHSHVALSSQFSGVVSVRKRGRVPSTCSDFKLLQSDSVGNRGHATHSGIGAGGLFLVASKLRPCPLSDGLNIIFWDEIREFTLEGMMLKGEI